MPEIIVEATDRLDYVLRVFKKKMQRSGILAELRKRRHYLKPSAAKKVKAQSAKRARDKAKRMARQSSRS
jgi:small subunit ribosomal protein S21